MSDDSIKYVWPIGKPTAFMSIDASIYLHPENILDFIKPSELVEVMPGYGVYVKTESPDDRSVIFPHTLIRYEEYEIFDTEIEALEAVKGRVASKLKALEEVKANLMYTSGQIDGAILKALVDKS